MARREFIVVDERVAVVASLNKNCVDKHGSLTLLLFWRAVKQGYCDCLRRIDWARHKNQHHRCHCHDDDDGGKSLLFG